MKINIRFADYGDGSVKTLIAISGRNLAKRRSHTCNDRKAH